jgi:hypothetical protein
MHGAILPLPQYAFMAWCLVKHRDNFTFYNAKVMETNTDSMSIFITHSLFFLTGYWNSFIMENQCGHDVTLHVGN